MQKATHINFIKGIWGQKGGPQTSYRFPHILPRRWLGTLTVRQKPSIFVNFSQFGPMLGQSSANFSQFLAKETPELFDKVKAGEFTFKEVEF